MQKIRLGQGHLAWLTVIFLLVIWTALEGPFTYAMGKTNIRMWQLILDPIISIFFMIDVYINLKHQPHNARESQVLYFQGYHNYRKGFWLPIDIISCIPFDILAYMIGIGPEASILRLLRLAKVLRIIKLYSYLGSFTFLPKQFRMFFVAALSTVVVHWVACGWILTEFPLEASKRTWTHYNEALYWAVTTVTTIGYGDIVPQSNIGRLYTMTIMILGVAVYGVVIGTISKIIVQSGRHKEALKERLRDLNLLMQHYEIPHRVRIDVFSYYHNLLEDRLSDNDNKIIADLPAVLKDEILTYMDVKLISKIPLFNNCSIECLREVISDMDKVSFSPDQMIMQKGEVGEEMYVISHGTVEIMNDDEKAINTLKNGQFFGEIALMKKIKRGASVKAKTYCDLYRLSKESFTKLTEKHDQLRENIEAVIQKRSSDRSRK